MDYESLIYVDRNGTDCLKWDGAAERFGEPGLLPLWVADMDFQAPACVREAVASWAAHGAYGYGVIPDRWYKAFQNWEYQRHGWRVERDWLRPAPGVVPALYWLVQALTVPGDSVTVLTPVYYPFFDAIEETGRVLTPCQLTNEGGRYTMDFAALEKHFTQTGSKLLIFSSPHNPVGRVWRREELEQLGEICQKYHVTILSDEIHQDLVLGSHPHIPTATAVKCPVVTLCSASKTFNLAGLQNAFVILPDEALREKYDAFVKTVAWQSGPPVGFAAAAAAFREGAPWLNSLLDRVYDNYQTVCAEFQERLPEAVISPLEGTYLLWIDLRPCLNPEQTKFIVQEVCGLAVDYGEWFGGDAYKGFIRLNLATSHDNITLAVSRLLAALTE